MGRMGNEADMAGAALYYSSRAASWVTGTVLPVDGGQLISLKSAL
jgi:NAD(P)-dependent dehydrogenase (short-subunit alcohol dehydrogenase family)